MPRCARTPTSGTTSLLKAEHLAGVHDNEVLTTAKEIVYTHHERWDGSGYPRGLKGTAIPLAGRLVAVVDVYDALVEARAYKPALPPERAREVIVQGRGIHFDPDIVDAFVACFPRFPGVRRADDGTSDAARGEVAPDGRVKSASTRAARPRPWAGPA